MTLCRHLFVLSSAAGLVLWAWRVGDILADSGGYPAWAAAQHSAANASSVASIDHQGG